MENKKNMIVTGGAGFIGSTFVIQNLERGHNVVVLDSLTYAGHKENLDTVNDDKNFTLVVGDIKDRSLVADLLRKHDIDYLVNFAAESHVDNSIEKPADFIETNILGTYNLLECARAYYNELSGSKKADFRYLQISTDEVFGSLQEDGSKFHEKYPYSPSSPYSASKAAGDHLVNAWHHTYKMPVITTNCTNNYGPRQYPEKLIPVVIDAALSGKDIPIYGSGKNIRDWIHVEDHCNGVYLALTKGKLGESYCFGGNAEKRNIEVVNTICEMLDAHRPKECGTSYKKQIVFVEDRKGHDWRYAIDDSFAKEKLNYKRKYDFASGIKNTVEWYLDNKDWAKKVVSKNKN